MFLCGIFLTGTDAAYSGGGGGYYGGAGGHHGPGAGGSGYIDGVIDALATADTAEKLKAE